MDGSDFMATMGYGRASEKLRAVLPLLEARDVKLAAASYSGGNDEGGVQDVTLFSVVQRNADGEAVVPADLPAEHPGYVAYKAAELEYDGDWEDPIHSGLDDILSTKYGSWAGDFSAYGTLYVDVEKRRCWMDGSETTEQSVPVNDAIDVTV